MRAFVKVIFRGTGLESVADGLIAGGLGRRGEGGVGIFPPGGAEGDGQQHLAFVPHAGLLVSDLKQGMVDLVKGGQGRLGDVGLKIVRQCIGVVIVGHEDHFVHNVANGPPVIALVVFHGRQGTIQQV